MNHRKAARKKRTHSPFMLIVSQELIYLIGGIKFGAYGTEIDLNRSRIAKRTMLQV